MKSYKFCVYQNKKYKNILKQMFMAGRIYNTLLDIKEFYRRHLDRPLNKDNIADKEAILYNAQIVNTIRKLLYRLNINVIIQNEERDDIYRIVDTVTYYLKYNRIVAGENNELITDEQIQEISVLIKEKLQKRVGYKIKGYDILNVLSIIRHYCNIGKEAYITGIDLTNFLTLIKRDKRYLKYNTLPASTAQAPAHTIAASYQLFFSNLKSNPERAGKPQFKKAKLNTFLVYRDSYKIIDNKIILSYKDIINSKDGIKKIRKYVSILFHKDREIEGTIKQITFSKDKIDNIYICIATDIKDNIQYPNVNRSDIGIQWGGDPFLILSTGETIKLPTLYQEIEEKAIKEQKKLSRKVGARKNERKSNNFERQRKKLARVFKRKTNLREDWEWTTAVQLCNSYKTIIIKNPNLKALQQEGKGKLLLDVSYGTFLNKLKYQCEKRNVNFIVLPKDSEAETAEEILKEGLLLTKST